MEFAINNFINDDQNEAKLFWPQIEVWIMPVKFIIMLWYLE